MSHSPASLTPTFQIRRRRAIVACVNCRRRKIKCITTEDPPQGQCERCSKRGLSCEYLTVAEDPAQTRSSISRRTTNQPSATLLPPHIPPPHNPPIAMYEGSGRDPGPSVRGPETPSSIFDWPSPGPRQGFDAVDLQIQGSSQLRSYASEPNIASTSDHISPPWSHSPLEPGHPTAQFPQVLDPISGDRCDYSHVFDWGLNRRNTYPGNADRPYAIRYLKVPAKLGKVGIGNGVVNGSPRTPDHELITIVRFIRCCNPAAPASRQLNYLDSVRACWMTSGAHANCLTAMLSRPVARTMGVDENFDDDKTRIRF
ncbi:hypothetical protein DFH07DRAFT_1030285 [Mycena maculata]|uniref:Zn(2)-C6 fungal-type domain-containing protein n=1 Tax=Mycena maculata TaxID=230809 RepID=A0AAD7K6S1_9AGAR|nr:hypothetical protein DFH07DRAFT_1030285 [Mycena maculata]